MKVANSVITFSDLLSILNPSPSPRLRAYWAALGEVGGVAGQGRQDVAVRFVYLNAVVSPNP